MNTHELTFRAGRNHKTGALQMQADFDLDGKQALGVPSSHGPQPQAGETWTGEIVKQLAPPRGNRGGIHLFVLEERQEGTSSIGTGTDSEADPDVGRCFEDATFSFNPSRDQFQSKQRDSVGTLILTPDRYLYPKGAYDMDTFFRKRAHRTCYIQKVVHRGDNGFRIAVVRFDEEPPLTKQ